MWNSRNQFKALSDIMEWAQVCWCRRLLVNNVIGRSLIMDVSMHRIISFRIHLIAQHLSTHMSLNYTNGFLSSVYFIIYSKAYATTNRNRWRKNRQKLINDSSVGSISWTNKTIVLERHPQCGLMFIQASIIANCHSRAVLLHSLCSSSSSSSSSLLIW